MWVAGAGNGRLKQPPNQNTDLISERPPRWRSFYLRSRHALHAVNYQISIYIAAVFAPKGNIETAVHILGISMCR